MIQPISTGNFITPLQPLQTMIRPAQEQGEQFGVAGAFGQMFSNAISQFEAMEAQNRVNSFLLAIGEVDDIAAIELASQRTSTMLTMMMQVRNTLVDSYNEIMRMNI